MKKTIEHGKIWLIAAFISFASFLFLQIDQTNLAKKQQLAQIEQEDGPTYLTVESDIVKGITFLVIEFFRVK